ncbi:hypothetical protein L1987_48327 [Smallanthus sonchifolius]|uniref:Uncharacterized protein n=1 Tax=Smallanthus sonchifolius TaxID=185202 RepID=A0ACB9FRN2_9ASTR|nr:hypothetical protein L1987_48327 [Smallanthus sonchifolius]
MNENKVGSDSKDVSVQSPVVSDDDFEEMLKVVTVHSIGCGRIRKLKLANSYLVRFSGSGLAVVVMQLFPIHQFSHIRAAMEKLAMMRSIYRSISRRSLGFISPAAVTSNHQCVRSGIHQFHHSPASMLSNNRSSFTMGIGSIRCFSDGLTHLPDIKDGDIKLAFKELMAVNWAELPDTVVNKTK